MKCFFTISQSSRTPKTITYDMERLPGQTWRPKQSDQCATSIVLNSRQRYVQHIAQ